MALLKALSRAVPVALLLLAGALVATPLGVGFSTGISKDNAPPGEGFAKFGCAECHGEHLVYADVDTAAVTVHASAADGKRLNGPYTAHTVYTISISLAESNNPTAANHAGFNLRASSGKLSGVEGQSQASGDGTQATHVGPGRTSWNVSWEAPESGAAGFSLFVNDVDGDQVNSEGDQVRWVQFGFADKDGAVLGAVSEEEVEFGITLQQYWIGLIALIGMIFVMVAGFVYLKFVNPHNTDQKDR